MTETSTPSVGDTIRVHDNHMMSFRGTVTHVNEHGITVDIGGLSVRVPHGGKRWLTVLP